MGERRGRRLGGRVDPVRGGGESLEVKGACYNTSLTLVIPAYIHGYRPALLCLPAIPSLPPYSSCTASASSISSAWRPPHRRLREGDPPIAPVQRTRPSSIAPTRSAAASSNANAGPSRPSSDHPRSLREAEQPFSIRRGNLPSCCVHADQSPLDMVSDSIQRCTVRCATPSPSGLGQLSQHRSVDVSASTVTMIGTTPRWIHVPDPSLPGSSPIPLTIPPILKVTGWLVSGYELPCRRHRTPCRTGPGR
ncbi:hypothetical protein C8Q76DRAFT_150587 [Earliella scabrosa]|nr:hypothetical protein C8Q76DRAFT_150587 [Earliella scabrosa]